MRLPAMKQAFPGLHGPWSGAGPWPAAARGTCARIGGKGKGGLPTRTVKWFNSTKGFGVMVPQGGGKGIFVHLPAVDPRDPHLKVSGRPRLFSWEIIGMISPGARVLFSAWSCGRRKEIQMR
jgi:hypothetical protein